MKGHDVRVVVGHPPGDRDVRLPRHDLGDGERGRPQAADRRTRLLRAEGAGEGMTMRRPRRHSSRISWRLARMDHPPSWTAWPTHVGTSQASTRKPATSAREIELDTASIAIFFT